MIFDYYCMDCGNKFSGEEINFDLAELLGLKGDNTSSVVGSKTTQISAQKLKELARKSGVKLEHNKRARITITLSELLEIMGENAGGKVLMNKMRSFTHSELNDAVYEVFSSSENQEVVDQLVYGYVNAINAHFEEKIEDGEEGGSGGNEEEASDSNDDYEASFWIEPEMFEDGKSDAIYTLKYSWEEDTPNMKSMVAPTEIRGYCPKCGKPIISGAGKYQHVLVGLLGVQSAGKTTAIVAMLSQIRESYSEMGIKYPGNPLCDSRYSERVFNGLLYDNGWAVKKTAADTNASSFNASLMLTTDDGRLTKIVTFIDIAGEQCYDLKTNQMNAKALEVYPLINSCDIYLLCTCIDQVGYGNAEGDEAIIPKDAVMQIAQGIYANLRNPHRVPPMCLLLTKADMADGTGASPDENNPFKSLQINKEYKNYKVFGEQWDNLVSTYDSTTDDNIREPLKWCCNVYKDLQDQVYLSMFSISALGRKGEKFESDLAEEIVPWRDENGKVQLFERKRVDVLWKWILQVAGIMSVDEKKREFVPYIPSFNEHYIDTKSENAAADENKVYSISQAVTRVGYVKKLFLNVSEGDRKIIRAYKDDDGGGFLSFFGKKKDPQEKVRDAIISAKLV